MMKIETTLSKKKKKGLFTIVSKRLTAKALAISSSF